MMQEFTIEELELLWLLVTNSYSVREINSGLRDLLNKINYSIEFLQNKGL